MTISERVMTPYTGLCVQSSTAWMTTNSTRAERADDRYAGSPDSPRLRGEPSRGPRPETRLGFRRDEESQSDRYADAARAAPVT